MKGRNSLEDVVIDLCYPIVPFPLFCLVRGAAWQCAVFERPAPHRVTSDLTTLNLQFTPTLAHLLHSLYISFIIPSIPSANPSPDPPIPTIPQLVKPYPSSHPPLLGLLTFDAPHYLLRYVQPRDVRCPLSRSVPSHPLGR
jgi:hypothetical protein